MIEKCIICNSFKPDHHHVKTRGSGGTDDIWNMVPLCRLHHTEIHPMGTKRFAEKYRVFYDWLISNGWEYDTYVEKWRRY